MKVLLLNGSPHAKGCTYTALAEAAGALEAAGVETEFVHIGTKAIRGCIGCGKCREAKRCVFDDDPVNEAIEKARACDGFIFGSPVYYASPNGAALAFLDRLFYAGGSALRYKPGAAAQPPRWTRCTNILPSNVCREYLQNTGTWCMATRPMRCGRTWKACR